MYNRTCRILQGPSATSTSQFGNAPHQRTTPNRLPNHVRIHLWRRLLLKIGWVFEQITLQTRNRAILGEKVYNSWFTAPMPEWVSEATQQVVHRVIKGQAVGRQLPRGTGAKDLAKAHMDPTMCKHPEDDMIIRGNAKQRWWMCTKCASRWNRLEVAEVNASPEPMDDDVVTFGKHMGKKFVEVYMQHPDYCEWVMHTVAQADTFTPSAELQRLAHFIHTHQMLETHAADGWSEIESMDQEP